MATKKFAYLPDGFFFVMLAPTKNLFRLALWETEQKQIPGLLLLVDFEKAFDTVEWNFISKTLEYFGPSVKKCMDSFILHRSTVMCYTKWPYIRI